MEHALLLSRVAALQVLEGERDLHRIYKVQGRIQELRALMHLPAEVEEKLIEFQHEEEKDRIQQQKETKENRDESKRTLIW